MSLKTVAEKDLSYELYKEIAEELCVPVDSKLSREVRYELYNSKLVFLRNLYEQCFRAVNGRAGRKILNDENYTGDDLKLIHKAIEVTNEFLRETVLEAMHEALHSVESRSRQGISLATEEFPHASTY